MTNLNDKEEQMIYELANKEKTTEEIISITNIDKETIVYFLQKAGYKELWVKK